MTRGPDPWVRNSGAARSTSVADRLKSQYEFPPQRVNSCGFTEIALIEPAQNKAAVR